MTDLIESLLDNLVESIETVDAVADKLIGKTGRDGSNLIVGGKRNDEFSGGKGDDFLDGRSGNDILWGNHGDDRIYGGDGHDGLDGGRGDDVLTGGQGNDVSVFREHFGHDEIRDFGDGDDRIEFDSRVFSDIY